MSPRLLLRQYVTPHVYRMLRQTDSADDPFPLAHIQFSLNLACSGLYAYFKQFQLTNEQLRGQVNHGVVGTCNERECWQRRQVVINFHANFLHHFDLTLSFQVHWVDINFFFLTMQVRTKIAFLAFAQHSYPCPKVLFTLGFAKVHFSGNPNSTSKAKFRNPCE